MPRLLPGLTTAAAGTVTTPPARTVDGVTAHYSAAAAEYEQLWASALHPAGVQLLHRLPLGFSQRVLDLAPASEHCCPRFGELRHRR